MMNCCTKYNLKKNILNKTFDIQKVCSLYNPLQTLKIASLGESNSMEALFNSAIPGKGGFRVPKRQKMSGILI
jgi:hypothetical protein